MDAPGRELLDMTVASGLGTDTAPFDVVVGGAGIVGLAAALALHAAADGTLRVALVDPRPSHDRRNDRRALALSAASRHMLQVLGAWEAIEPHAEPMRSIAISDAPLADVLRPLLLGFPEDSLDGEVFAHVVPAEAIIASLRARVAAAGVAVLPWAIEGRESAPGATRLRFAGGSTAVTRLLVAADGSASPLRVAAGIQSFAWTYEQHALVTTVGLAEPHGGRAIQHFLPGGPFALLPLRGQRAAVVWSERSGEALRIAELPDSDFMQALSLRAGPELGPMTLEGPRGCTPLRGMIARALTADRLVLVGDAARVLHPIAGQGVNVGLRDVAALAEITVAAARLGEDVGAPQTLARYERWRRFDGAAMVVATDSLNRLFRLDGTVIRSLRDAGLGALDGSAAAKRRIVRAAAGLAGRRPLLLEGALP